MKFMPSEVFVFSFQFSVFAALLKHLFSRSRVGVFVQGKWSLWENEYQDSFIMIASTNTRAVRHTQT